MKDKTVILSKSPFFRGVEPEEIDRLLKNITHNYVKHSSGKTIALRGSRCQNLLIMMSGSVKCEMVDMNGKAMEVETVSAPRPLAPAFLFGQKNRFPVDVIAAGPVEILSIPVQSLVLLFQKSSKVLNNYLNIICNRTHFLTDRLWFMSFKTIRGKFIHYLLTLCPEDSNEVTLPKSQQELSEYFGVSRPSLSRVIGDLEKEGLIEHQRKKIILLDKEALKISDEE